MTLDPQALKAAARCSYQYEGDRKKIAYVGWDNEPEEVRDEWRVSVAVAVDAYQGAAWQDISTAPQDPNLWVIVYAPEREGLKAIVCPCQWHPNAGHCVDEIRHVTHWQPLPNPPASP